MIDVRVLDLPFEEAVAYFASKGVRITPQGWREMWQEAHTRAFTVARVTQMDVLLDIRKEVQKALDAGTSLGEFKASLKETLERKGWFAPRGEEIWETLPDGTRRKKINPWRLETIYRANLQTAYSVGRFKQMEAVKARRPYRQYKAILDRRTRHDHAAMNDRVYHADHPIWSKWYPPNGFNCFPGGTLILSPSGWKPIETIQIEDRVIGGGNEEQRVSAIHRNVFNEELTRLVLKDHRIDATPNHRILTMNGWMRADSIKAGDVLVQTAEAPPVDSFVCDVDHPYAERSDSGLASFPSFDFEVTEQSHQGASVNPPSGAELSVREFFHDVQTIEDLGNGAPLDAFDTLDDFRCWARSHCILREVVAVHTIPYNGIVYNLSVDPGKSYIIPGAIVHNCRCYVKALSARQMEKRGLTESVRGVSEQPDEGWRYHVGEAGLSAWQPDLNKYAYEPARHYVQDAVRSPSFERFFEGKTQGAFPVAVMDEPLRRAIRSDAQTVLLSEATLTKNKAHHKDLTLADYQKIPAVIEEAQLIVQDGDQTLVFLRRNGKIFHAVVKSTRTGKGLFVTSFRLTGENDLERVRRRGKVIRDEM